MAGIIGLVGLIFVVASLLSLIHVTDFLLKIVMITQLHHLPLLNLVAENWVYMGLGLVLLIIAGSMQTTRKGVTVHIEQD